MSRQLVLGLVLGLALGSLGRASAEALPGLERVVRVLEAQVRATQDLVRATEKRCR